MIEGVGPRYCPSIEDKIVRFADKSSHQVFVEPEGLNTDEVYPNGISTSLPFETQLRFVRSMQGFQNAKITQPGYAIEYDYFDPRDLKPTLERSMSAVCFSPDRSTARPATKKPARRVACRHQCGARSSWTGRWYPLRSEAYLGVLVDDLITRGVSEPYRMFTSRAEYRLLLREDNADLRLTPIGRELGLVDDERWQQFIRKRDCVVMNRHDWRNMLVRPQSLTDADREVLGESLSLAKRMLRHCLRRPGFDYRRVTSLSVVGAGNWPDDFEPVSSSNRSSHRSRSRRAMTGYIERQQREIEKHARQEHLRLPEDLDYDAVSGLSIEGTATPDARSSADARPGIPPGGCDAVHGLVAADSPEEATTPKGELRHIGPPRFRYAGPMNRLTSLLLILLLVVTGCGDAGDPQVAAILQRGIGEEPASLDVHKSNSTEAGHVQRDLGEGLVSYSPTGELIPGSSQ